MTILYVDDDPDDRQIFQEAVKSIDSRTICVTAQDGLDALSYLSMHEPPDLIFLDLNMPLMDGKTCLGEIRGNKATGHLPVIVFTTSGNNRDRVDCENLGATDFLLKPVSFRHMREMLRSAFACSQYTPAPQKSI
jgi:CheY-like chemotaxis protein